MPPTINERIRLAILDHRYVLSEHAYDEMDADRLDALDVESAILTGAVVRELTDDARGTRYVVEGKACDLATDVGVVVRFVEREQALIVTVYQLQ